MCSSCSSLSRPSCRLSSPTRVIASELRALLDPQHKALDAMRAASALGYRVVFAHHLGGPSGMIAGDVIFVQSGGCDRWNRHVIAHELAHAIADRKHVFVAGNHDEEIIEAATYAALAVG